MLKRTSVLRLATYTPPPKHLPRMRGWVVVGVGEGAMTGQAGVGRVGAFSGQAGMSAVARRR